MNPQKTFKLAPTELPPDMQCEVDNLQVVGALTQQHLRKVERSGKILKKSIEMSTETRKAGNDLLTRKGHDSQIHNEILRQYSKSIAFAPKGTDELALGYSNRSFLLMHLHRYKESLVDIDRALQLSTSDPLKKKLLDRQEKCLGLINEENLKKSTKNLTLSDNNDEESLATKLKNFKPSATIPCASDCVGLAYNETFGRHLVAARDIQPGEILIIEEGYACYPMLDQIYLVCSHCLQIAWNGIPCDDCVFAVYCSETCKNEAFNEYHDIECPMVQYMDCTVFNNEKNGYDRMATIRLLIKALRKEGLESIMKEVFEKEKNLDALLSDGILKSDKFKSCYNLLSHAEEFGTENEKYEFHTSQIVCLLIEHTDFLVSLIGKNSLDNIAMDVLSPVSHEFNNIDPCVLLKMKEVLMKLKYLTIANGYLFQTTPWQCGCNNFYECPKKCNLFRGIVVVPCCSLLNHSCTPNVSHAFEPKRKIIVFSTSPIKKGEQLCDTYGVTLIHGDLKVRENRAKELNFTCKCQACLDKIDVSMVPEVCKKEWMQILTEFKESFPMGMKNSFFMDTHENCEMSEEVLQYVIKMSQLYYKYFNYYEAFKHSYKCRAYIEKMMSKLYEEKSAIPNNC